MSLRKLAVLLIAATSPLCWGSEGAASAFGAGVQRTLVNRERQIWTGEVHNSDFSPMGRTETRNSCDPVQPPEALATPDPLIDLSVARTKVTVSFIVGTDGRVHSPLILEGLGGFQDRIVLDALRSWRYRPATCNGVPTEAEAKIAFSSRQ